MTAAAGILGRENRAALAFFLPYMRRRAGRLAGYAVGALLQSSLVWPTLLLVRQAFDVAIPRGEIGTVLRIGAGLVLLRLAGGALAVGLRRHVVHTVKGMVTDVRVDVARALLERDRDFFISADLSATHTRIVQDSERLDNLALSLISGVLPAVLSAVVILAVLVKLDWQLLLLAVLLAPLLWIGNRLTMPVVERDLARFRGSFERFSTSAQFLLRYAELIRHSVREDAELARQAAMSDELRRTGIDMAMSFAVHGQVQRVLVGVAGVIVLVAGGIQVAGGHVTLGAFLAFWVAAGMATANTSALLTAVPDLVSGIAALRALKELAEPAGTVPYTGTREIPFEGEVTFEAVHFRYAEREVLKGVDLTVPAGSVVALRGQNGAGKSTMLHLLSGFYRPRSGRLLADGVPYDDLDMRALRRRIGVVPQHPQFFPGTLRENLLFGHPDADDAELRVALERSLALPVLERMPHGLETALGERGARLSGGELQRLAIARAMLGSPRVLVLDEPSTHLDATAISELVRSLANWPDRPTVLLISHDPAVTAIADVVHELHDGRLRQLAAHAAAGD